ncbi:hypothetical protein L1049_009555 [Liquidambar formosana]|uniref:Uncharacterized protein n=1 Tax=Liquidambar formosana TaxID=63359 RepID=A0AAP0R688_LIQFO
MAYDDAMQSLFPESIDPSHLNERNALKRRKYHPCRSAPLTDIDWPEQIGIVSITSISCAQFSKTTT